MRSSTPWALVFVISVALGLHPGTVAAHGAFHERLGELDHDIDRSPSDQEPWLARSFLFRSHGDLDRALADLARATALEPHRHDLHLHRGRIWLESGDSAGAEAAFARFLAVEPHHAGARAERARALLQLSRPLEAAAELDAALVASEVAVPELYLERSRALALAGEAHLPAAIAGLDEGIAALGPVDSLEREALELEVRSGRLGPALIRVDRMAGRSPRPEAWLVRRGEILEQMRRREEARAAYGRALAAIAQLPEHRRVTPAVRQLESRAGESLARLDGAESKP
ncbi:MAG: tetratricopeptide repeat protein [Myxococcota bacterium]